MKHAAYSTFCRFGHHRARIIFCIPRVHHDRLLCIVREGELLGEGPALLQARRIVVMVVEAALSYCNGSVVHEIAKNVHVARRIESDGVVRVNARSVPDETGMRPGDEGGCASGAEDILGAAS